MIQAPRSKPGATADRSPPGRRAARPPGRASEDTSPALEARGDSGQVANVGAEPRGLPDAHRMTQAPRSKPGGDSGQVATWAPSRAASRTCIGWHRRHQHLGIELVESPAQQGQRNEPQVLLLQQWLLLLHQSPAPQHRVPHTVPPHVLQVSGCPGGAIRQAFAQWLGPVGTWWVELYSVWASPRPENPSSVEKPQ